jgi:hypothetical protein
MDFRELGILRLLEQDRERFEGIPPEDRYDPPIRSPFMPVNEWDNMVNQQIEAGLERTTPMLEGAMPFGVGSVAGPVVRGGRSLIGKAYDALKGNRNVAGDPIESFGTVVGRKFVNPAYGGAARQGQMIFGRDEAGRTISRVAQRAGEGAYGRTPTDLSKRIAAVGAGIGTAELFDDPSDTLLPIDDPRIRDEIQRQSAFEERGRIPSLLEVALPTEEEQAIQNLVSQQPATVVEAEAIEPTVADSVTTDSDASQDTSSEVKPDVNANLKSIKDNETNQSSMSPEERTALYSKYGPYARDPKKRKKVYLEELNKIYRNAMILNIIAQLTGGRSMANDYIKMATVKMDAAQKFDEEARMQGIWNETFFDANGQFRQGMSWQDIYETAIQRGASPQEAKEIADTSGLPQTVKRTGTQISQMNQFKIFGHAEDLGLSAQQIAEVGEIINLKGAAKELQNRYPELARRIREDKTMDQSELSNLLNALRNPSSQGSNPPVSNRTNKTVKIIE